MKKIVVQSYAKINLCLDITGLRKDGFHLLDMVMVPISLHDTLLIEETPRAIDNYITLDEFTIGDSQYNTVTQAINFLDNKFKLNTKFKIDMHKVIPMKAGLGGGSSNAACTMVALNKYLKLNLTNEEMILEGKSLGADIPFFIMGKPARCRGIGEQLDFVNVKNDYHVLLVKPEAGCSTKGVYEVSDTMDLPTGNVEKVIEALETGDDDLLAASIFNALEGPAISLVPEIASIKQEMLDAGLRIVQMTGSGSAVFALSTDKALIKKIAKQFENRYLVEITKVIK